MMPNASIPIFLLTGAPGAGKTTLLNHLLKQPVFHEGSTCLLINEFGQMGVDGALVEAGDRPVFEINKGSVFCVCVKTDFIKSLRAIGGGVRPDRLVIEATGVAEPRDIEDFVDVPGLAEAFRIEANLCVIDAKDFIRLAPMLRAARQQATWADGLVINKCDLVSDGELAQLEAVLRDMNPRAPIARVRNGELPEGFLEGISHEVLRGDPLTEPPDPVFAESFTSDSPVDRSVFEQALRQLGEHLLRLKGQVDFGGGPGFFEYAGGELLASAEKSIRRVARHPTSLVAIGWSMEQSEFRAVIESALR